MTVFVLCKRLHDHVLLVCNTLSCWSWPLFILKTRGFSISLAAFSKKHCVSCTGLLPVSEYFIYFYISALSSWNVIALVSSSGHWYLTSYKDYLMYYLSFLCAPAELMPLPVLKYLDLTYNNRYFGTVVGLCVCFLW